MFSNCNSIDDYSKIEQPELSTPFISPFSDGGVEYSIKEYPKSRYENNFNLDYSLGLDIVKDIFEHQSDSNIFMGMPDMDLAPDFASDVGADTFRIAESHNLNDNTTNLFDSPNAQFGNIDMQTGFPSQFGADINPLNSYSKYEHSFHNSTGYLPIASTYFNNNYTNWNDCYNTTFTALNDFNMPISITNNQYIKKEQLSDIKSSPPSFSDVDMPSNYPTYFNQCRYSPELPKVMRLESTKRTQKVIPNVPAASFKLMDLFYCSKCSYSCKSRDKMTKHTTKHNKEYNSARCNVCFSILENEDCPTAHMQCYYNSCPEDNFSVNYREDNGFIKVMTRPVGRKNAAKPVEKANLKGIRKSVKKKVKIKDTPKYMHECPMCFFRTPFERKYNIHLKNIHPEYKRLKCNVCSYRCRYWQNLRVHLSKHTGEKNLECNVCSFRTANAYCLRRHKLLHTVNEVFSCENCSYETFRKDNMEKHKRLHSKKATHCCPKCSYKVIRKQDFDRHLLTHYDGVSAANLNNTAPEPFQCEFCSFPCKNARNLRRHLLRHTGKKPFKCSLCSFTSARRDNVRSHMKKHSPDKPFECDICSYRCRSKNSLIRHDETHRDYFRCKFCRYKTKDVEVLKKHNEICNNDLPVISEIFLPNKLEEKQFKCSVCSYQTEYDEIMQLHLKNHEEFKKEGGTICLKEEDVTKEFEFKEILIQCRSPISVDVATDVIETSSITVIEEVTTYIE